AWQSQSQNGFHWLHLIEMEKRLEGRFYRFASLFVDVPHLQSNVRNRQWLAFVTRFFPFTSASAYKYLYLKTFVRANEYLGIYIRLTIIGAVVVYWIPDLYGKVIAYTLFLFMMSIQIKALFLHHQHQFWFRLFPLPQTQLKKDFQWLNGLLLFVQSVIMYLPILWLEGSFLIVALPAIGLIYSFVYSSVYLSKVLKT
uniref:ABC transporter permease n=1 Tax=Caldalkalibacillus mannanilyticus TaxID=1418 RepID=UPI00046AEDE3